MIDEQKLITEVNEAGGCDAKDEYSKGWDDAIGEVLRIINEQPKVGEWIPCSERLPNDMAIHEVTAQFSNGTIYTEFAYYDESREEWWKFDDDGMMNVVAWKEHSEPYKGE